MLLLFRLLLMLAVLAVGIGSVVLGFLLPPLGVVMLIGVAVIGFSPRTRMLTSHGQARLLSLAEMLRDGCFGTEGLLVGTSGYAPPPSLLAAVGLLFSGVSSRHALSMLAAALSRRSADGEAVRIKTCIHSAVFAPTGMGKGVSLLIPNLLLHLGSCVVADPQGSLYRETAEYRRRHFRTQVVLIDPHHVCGQGSDSFNPLDLIDPKALDFPEQCLDLAASFIHRTGDEKEPHWNDSAERIIQCFIAYVCACEPNPRLRTLLTVRILLSSPAAYAEALENMKRQPILDGMIARMSDSMSNYKDKELASVLTTVQRHTAFLDSPAMQAVTASSTIDLRELRNGRLSLYLVLPPHRLETIPGAMRMWLTTAINTLVSMGASERNPVLFVIDECAHLGKTKALQSAVSLMRGYGIRLLLCFQSIGQIEECYGEKTAHTLLDNIGLQIFFGTTAYKSAETISKRVGDFTMWIDSLNRTVQRSMPLVDDGKQSGSRSVSTATTLSRHGRAMFRPEEVLTLPRNLALVFWDNRPVMAVKLLRYFDSPLFGNRRPPRRRRAMAAAFLALIVLGVGLLYAFRPSPPTFDRLPDDPPQIFGDAFHIPPSRPDPRFRSPGVDPLVIPTRRFGRGRSL